jgi:hypothetical protein
LKQPRQSDGNLWMNPRSGSQFSWVNLGKPSLAPPIETNCLEGNVYRYKGLLITWAPVDAAEANHSAAAEVKPVLVARIF